MQFSGSTSLTTSPSPSNTSTPHSTAVVQSSVVGGLVAAVVISFAVIAVVFIVVRRRRRASTSRSERPASNIRPFVVSFESPPISPRDLRPSAAFLPAESGLLQKHLLNTYRASKRMVDVLRHQDRRQARHHGGLDAAPPTYSEAVVA